MSRNHVLLIAACLLILLVTVCMAGKPSKLATRGTKLTKILNLMDTPAVDPSEQLAGGEKHGHVTEGWDAFNKDIQELHVSLLGVVKVVAKEVKDELVKELKAEGPDFRTRMQNTREKIKESIDALKAGGVKEKLKGLVSNFETKIKGAGDKELKGKWKKVKDKLIEEFKSVEELVREELGVLSDKLDKIFHRVGHHIAHKEHHPVLKCGSCGKQLTLKEFLSHYPDLVVSEEDWWNDIDVENFYLGWPEWANRYAVQCPQCQATNWVEVDFVSSEEEKQLEEEADLGEHPEAEAAEEVLQGMDQEGEASP